jgi:hypothetical protein
MRRRRHRRRYASGRRGLRTLLRAHRVKRVEVRRIRTPHIRKFFGTSRKWGLVVGGVVWMGYRSRAGALAEAKRVRRSERRLAREQAQFRKEVLALRRHRRARNPDQIILQGPGILGKYMKARSRGWRTLWTGEHKICMVRKKHRRRRR